MAKLKILRILGSMALLYFLGLVGLMGCKGNLDMEALQLAPGAVIDYGKLFTEGKFEKYIEAMALAKESQQNAESFFDRDLIAIIENVKTIGTLSKVALLKTDEQISENLTQRLETELRPLIKDADRDFTKLKALIEYFKDKTLVEDVTRKKDIILATLRSGQANHDEIAELARSVERQVKEFFGKSVLFALQLTQREINERLDQIGNYLSLQKSQVYLITGIKNTAATPEETAVRKSEIYDSIDKALNQLSYVRRLNDQITDLNRRVFAQLENQANALRDTIVSLEKEFGKVSGAGGAAIDVTNLTKALTLIDKVRKDFVPQVKIAENYKSDDLVIATKRSPAGVLFSNITGLFLHSNVDALAQALKNPNTKLFINYKGVGETDQIRALAVRVMAGRANGLDAEGVFEFRPQVVAQMANGLGLKGEQRALFFKSQARLAQKNYTPKNASAQQVFFIDFRDFGNESAADILAGFDNSKVIMLSSKSKAELFAKQGVPSGLADFSFTRMGPAEMAVTAQALLKEGNAQRAARNQAPVEEDYAAQMLAKSLSAFGEGKSDPKTLRDAVNILLANVSDKPSLSETEKQILNAVEQVLPGVYRGDIFASGALSEDFGILEHNLDGKIRFYFKKVREANRATIRLQETQAEEKEQERVRIAYSGDIQRVTLDAMQYRNAVQQQKTALAVTKNLGDAKNALDEFSEKVQFHAELLHEMTDLKECSNINLAASEKSAQQLIDELSVSFTARLNDYIKQKVAPIFPLIEDLKKNKKTSKRPILYGISLEQKTILALNCFIAEVPRYTNDAANYTRTKLEDLQRQNDNLKKEFLNRLNQIGGADYNVKYSAFDSFFGPSADNLITKFHTYFDLTGRLYSDFGAFVTPTQMSWFQEPLKSFPGIEWYYVRSWFLLYTIMFGKPGASPRFQNRLDNDVFIYDDAELYRKSDGTQFNPGTESLLAQFKTSFDPLNLKGRIGVDLIVENALAIVDLYEQLWGTLKINIEDLQKFYNDPGKVPFEQMRFVLSSQADITNLKFDASKVVLDAWRQKLIPAPLETYIQNVQSVAAPPAGLSSEIWSLVQQKMILIDQKNKEIKKLINLL